MADENETGKHIEETIKIVDIPKEELQAVEEIRKFMEEVAGDKGESFEPRESQYSVAQLVEVKLHGFPPVAS